LIWAFRAKLNPRRDCKRFQRFFSGPGGPGKIFKKKILNSSRRAHKPGVRLKSFPRRRFPAGPIGRGPSREISCGGDGEVSSWLYQRGGIRKRSNSNGRRSRRKPPVGARGPLRNGNWHIFLCLRGSGTFHPGPPQPKVEGEAPSRDFLVPSVSGWEFKFFGTGRRPLSSGVGQAFD